jgi:hypothetical protein
VLPLDEESDAEAELAPSVSSGDDTSAELRRAFWTLVLVFDVALLAGSLGAMLLAFRGELSLGGSLLFFGFGLGFYGWRRYQTVTDRDWPDESESESATDGGDATDAAAVADEPPEGEGA